MGARASTPLVVVFALALVVASASWAVGAASRRPHLVTTWSGDSTASVIVQVPDNVRAADLRAVTLALPERPTLRPVSVVPMWSRDLALAVVLAPRASLGDADRAAADSVAADLLLRAPERALMAVVAPGVPPRVSVPLTADPVAAVAALRGARPAGEPMEGAAIELAARQLVDAPRSARAVVVLAASPTPAPSQLPGLARALRESHAVLHVVHLSAAPTPVWDRLVAAAGGTSARPDGDPVTVIDPAAPLRHSYVLGFQVPPQALPVTGELRFPGAASTEPLRVELTREETAAFSGRGNTPPRWTASVVVPVLVLVLVPLVGLAFLVWTRWVGSATGRHERP